jgi:hypothetical protein
MPPKTLKKGRRAALVAAAAAAAAGQGLAPLLPGPAAAAAAAAPAPAASRKTARSAAAAPAAQAAAAAAPAAQAAAPAVSGKKAKLAAAAAAQAAAVAVAAAAAGLPASGSLSDGTTEEVLSASTAALPQPAVSRIPPHVANIRRDYGEAIVQTRATTGIDYDIAVSLLRQIMYALYHTSRSLILGAAAGGGAAAAAAGGAAAAANSASLLSEEEATEIIADIINNDASSVSGSSTLSSLNLEGVNNFTIQQVVTAVRQGRLTEHQREAIHKRMFDVLGLGVSIPLNIILGDPVVDPTSEEGIMQLDILRQIFGDKMENRAAFFIRVPRLRNLFYVPTPDNNGTDYLKPSDKTEDIEIALSVWDPTKLHALLLQKILMLPNGSAVDTLGYHITMGKSRIYGSSVRDGYHFSNHFFETAASSNAARNFETRRTHFSNIGTLVGEFNPAFVQKQPRRAGAGGAGAAAGGGGGGGAAAGGGGGGVKLLPFNPHSQPFFPSTKGGSRKYKSKSRQRTTRRRVIVNN